MKLSVYKNHLGSQIFLKKSRWSYKNGVIVSSRDIDYYGPNEFPNWFEFSENCVALVPILDFWNHSNNPSVEFLREKDGVGIMTLKEVNPGEELFSNYGYGFYFKYYYFLIATFLRRSPFSVTNNHFQSRNIVRKLSIFFS